MSPLFVQMIASTVFVSRQCLNQTYYFDVREDFDFDDRLLNACLSEGSVFLSTELLAFRNVNLFRDIAWV